MSTVILLQPLFAAFTGWLIMWLAIYLLFRPHTPKRFFGITIQGVIPGLQRQLPARIGRAAAAHLQLDDLATQMKDPAQLAGLMPGIEAHIDAFLQHRLKEKIPVLAMFLSDSITETIKAGLLEEIEALLPQVISQYADSLGAKLDIERMVTAKLSAVSVAQLEAGLRSQMGGALRKAKLMGALAGLLIGLVQLGISLCLQ